MVHVVHGMDKGTANNLCLFVLAVCQQHALTIVPPTWPLAAPRLWQGVLLKGALPCTTSINCREMARGRKSEAQVLVSHSMCWGVQANRLETAHSTCLPLQTSG